MWVDRKVSSWVRDYYSSDTKIEDILLSDDDCGFIDREVLMECDEEILDSRGIPIFEIYSDDGNLLMTEKDVEPKEI